jgi:hypothetical protein
MYNKEGQPILFFCVPADSILCRKIIAHLAPARLLLSWIVTLSSIFVCCQLYRRVTGDPRGQEHGAQQPA